MMTKVREGYKETEIGVIPEDWEVKELSSISELITKGTTPMTNGFDFVDEGINFVKIESINDSYGILEPKSFSKITEECHQKLSRSILKEGDILFAIAGATVGKCAMISSENIPANTNQALAIIRLKASQNKQFVFHQLRGYYIQQRISLIKTNTAQPNLNLKQINEFKFAYPKAIEEQQRIAEILSTTDAHLEKLDKGIEDYQLLKKGMMKKLLTEGIGHTEFKETEIGRIPKEWEIKTLGDLSKIKTGKTPPTKQIELYGDAYPWVTPSDIGKARGIENTERMLSFEGYKQTPVKLPPYTLLVTCIASIGKNAVLLKEGSCNQQINAILPNRAVYNTSYLYYWVQLNQKYLEGFSGKTAIPILNKSTFESIRLAVPSIFEQNEIASIIEPLDNHIERLKMQQNEFMLLKKVLIQKLLTGKIRTTEIKEMEE